MAEQLDRVDWFSLFHARGPASDTSGHLRALIGTDERAFVDGYSHLWSATLHREGKAWPATAPTALAVAELLDDPRLGPDDPSLQDAMLSYLQAVAVAADLGDQAEAIRARVKARALELTAWVGEYLQADVVGRARLWADGTGVGELVLEQARLACYDAVPELLRRTLPHLTRARPRHRVCAAAAVGALARHSTAEPRRPALVSSLESMAAAAESMYDLATYVIAIGQLGGDTRRWLTDPRPGVRGCAALAPGVAGDAAASTVLAELSRSPRAFAASFGDMAPPMHFMIPPYRNLLTQALIERVRDRSTLLAALIAALPLGRRSAYRTLAPYLRAMFPAPAHAVFLSPVQRNLARAIANWDELWSMGPDTLQAIFKPVGLSADRAGWVAMAAPTPGPPDHEAYTAKNLILFDSITAIRFRPAAYFGFARADPGLPGGVAELVRSEYMAAVAAGTVASFSIDVESDRRFTVDVHGHELPRVAGGKDVGIDAAFTRMHGHSPAACLSLASAICSRVWVQAWVDGQREEVEFVDGLAVGPARELGTDRSRTGYRVTFELDDDWLPLGT